MFAPGETCPDAFVSYRRTSSPKVPTKRYLLVIFSIASISCAVCNCLSHFGRQKMASAKAVRPLLKPSVLNFEQPAAVLIRGACNVLGSTALDFRYLLRDVLQIPRIVPLPAHRHWTEIRAVRLKVKRKPHNTACLSGTAPSPQAPFSRSYKSRVHRIPGTSRDAAVPSPSPRNRKSSGTRRAAPDSG